MRTFYKALIIWTRLDLRIARSAPSRNLPLIEQLLRDEDSYQRALIRLELSLL